MATRRYTIKRIAGLKESKFRAVVFLCCPDDRRIDAGAVFEQLERKKEMELRVSFDYWIDGGTADSRFHGWPNDPRYKECFVFKWKKNRQLHRFYGFLFHPTPFSNPKFQLCILVSHAVKTERETDSNELDLQDSLRNDASIHTAIREEFPEMKRGTGRWVN
jgi:hypothetical protein